MIRNLVFFLEEPSAKAMLEQICPKLVGAEIALHFIVFEGKQDLEKNLKRKLRLWQAPDSAFLVMRDQDSADCHEVKRRLVAICQEANRPNVLVRVACHELESFYLGDLQAVSEAYQMTLPTANTEKFRVPDHLANAAQELENITRRRYQKMDGSRRIGALLRLDGKNLSHSFNVLCAGIQMLAQSSN